MRDEVRRANFGEAWDVLAALSEVLPTGNEMVDGTVGKDNTETGAVTSMVGGIPAEVEVAASNEPFVFGEETAGN